MKPLVAAAATLITALTGFAIYQTIQLSHARKEIADLLTTRPLLRGAYLARAATRASGRAVLRVAS